jgi:UAA transporter family
MIPVMIMGTLVGGKRYSVIEYMCAGLIAGGISLFAAQVSRNTLLSLCNMQLSG